MCTLKEKSKTDDGRCFIGECQYCGWDSGEMERRKRIPLTEDKRTGLRRKDVDHRDVK